MFSRLSQPPETTSKGLLNFDVGRSGDVKQHWRGEEFVRIIVAHRHLKDSDHVCHVFVFKTEVFHVLCDI